MKKEKVKTVEEVIDVVGDFGPGPVKHEESYQADDNFDMSFDITGIQNDSQQIQLQDQAMMLPPHLGGDSNISLFSGVKILSFKGQDDNDSQQAAEAMIQLGNYSTIQQQAQDESMDFDPNYDPSDFLIKKDTNVQPEIQQQPQYQEPYEYPSNIQEAVSADELQQNYYGSFAQQSFNVNDFGFQQPQQTMQDDYSQPQSQPQLMMPNDGGGLADLEISDSEDEDDPTDPAEDLNSSQNPADTSKEDDEGLWF